MAGEGGGGVTSHKISLQYLFNLFEKQHSKAAKIIVNSAMDTSHTDASRLLIGIHLGPVYMDKSCPG